MTSPALSESSRPGVYTGRTTNWPMVAASVIIAIPLVGLGTGSNDSWSDLAFFWPMVLIAVVVIVNALTSTSLRVTAGPNGFTVHWGLIGWPRSHYRLDEIDHVEVIDLGGWRVSFGFWWTPRRTTRTLRLTPPRTTSWMVPPRSLRRHANDRTRSGRAIVRTDFSQYWCSGEMSSQRGRLRTRRPVADWR